MFTSIIVVSLVAGTIWFLTTPLRTGLWRFPGPWWRRYTDIFQVLDAYYERTRATVKSLHEDYGSVVVVGPRTLIFSDPDMIEKIYADRSPLPKTHHLMPLRHELNGNVYPNLVSTESTREHAVLKRPVAHIYSMSNVTKSERFIDECVVEFMHQLDQEFNGKDKAMPVYQWVHFYTYDTTMKIIADKNFGFMRGEANLEELFRGMSAAMKFRSIGTCMPWIYDIVKKSPLAKVMMQRLGTFPLRARDLIQARREKGMTSTKTSDREDLLDQLLATQEKFPQVVNEAVLMGYASTPLFAGGQPIAATLTSVMYFLAKNPAASAKLHAELQSCGFQMPPLWVEVQRLTYLEAVVRECMRCLPLGAALSRRAVQPDRPFVLPDGRRVPTGTAVAILGIATHFNRDIFGADADDFRPERWLQHPKESQDEYLKRLRWMNRADLSWGSGDRACIGKHVARCEMYKLIATVYSVFDIELADPSKEWVLRESLGVKQENVEVKFRFRPDASLDQLRSVK